MRRSTGPLFVQVRDGFEDRLRGRLCDDPARGHGERVEGDREEERVLSLEKLLEAKERVGRAKDRAFALGAWNAGIDQKRSQNPSEELRQKLNW